MIMDCLVESVYKNPKESLRMYLPMLPMQGLLFIGCSSTFSLGYFGNYGLYNLMFQVYFHLQFILLCIEDLTGSSKGSSRFPGFDYLLVTIPFAYHHLTSAVPQLLGFGGLSKEMISHQVWILGLLVTIYGILKMNYIVYSMLAQTFSKLNRPSFWFNHDKKALRAA